MEEEKQVSAPVEEMSSQDKLRQAEAKIANAAQELADRAKAKVQGIFGRSDGGH